MSAYLRAVREYLDNLGGSTSGDRRPGYLPRQMPANKNQHFVPRCHMRPFSLNEAGAAINVYNSSVDRGIRNAPVKGQCSRDYFYGRDLKIEKILQSFEGKYATTVAKISESPEELDNGDLERLRNFAYLQMSRTENTIKRRTAAMAEMDELVHRGFEEYRKEPIVASHDELVASSLKTYATTLKHIADLEVVLLRNCTSKGFVTSDDPAILTNRLHMQRLGGNGFGLISAGTQLFMPISPNVLLMCYDKGSYSTPNRNGIWIDIRKDSDVSAINELQYISCASNIYFRNWDDIEDIKRGFGEASPRRPHNWFRWWVGVRIAERKGGELYRRATDEEATSKAPKVISFSGIYPNPSRWISELVYRPKVFAYANGSSVGYVREGCLEAYGTAKRKFRRVEVKFERSYDPLGPKTAFLST